MKLKQALYGLIAILGFGVLMLAAPSVGAVDAIADACKADPSASICVASPNNSFNSIIDTVITTLLYIVGVLSVFMIIVGGLMYVTSAGDSARVTKAKNTIIYSVIGLVFAFLAYAIVKYVVALFV